jgi:hypothetical protein
MKATAWLALVGLSLLLVACGPAETEGVPDLDAEEIPAVDAAEQFLADRLGITLEEIVIVRVEDAEWPDGCLGLPEGGEVCTQVITPGFRVVLRAQGQEYTLRTDTSGDVARLELTQSS